MPTYGWHNMIGQDGQVYSKRSCLHYTRGIALKRVASGVLDLGGFAPGQYSSEKSVGAVASC